ncbi:nucleoside hydrolase [Roseibacterium beibuensis]|uniref:nucleoside hydrolase n=1 Tax=[Roseibacterium] beibuensis TaxID=1193142 RepID=UPI00217CC832|nr:nucleoside hydrolase [Roseibacterium beibuensis]MCS6624489.1 nucleoside hydrolase [Roseibacterium beibuensis]
MNRQSLIIDCDPGVDDAVGLMLAFGADELELLAITAVGGNVPVEKTARNARMLRQIAGREDVPVFMGAARPLRREPAGAGEFHGAEGLGDMAPFEPDAPCAEGHAADAIVALVMGRPERSVAIAVMGPLTNLALALRREPGLAKRLGPVAVMGGARSEGGNITASAEFNIWADPEAAAEVLASGCDVVLFGLDATHQVRATEERIAALEAIGTARAEAAASMMRFSQRIEREIVGWDAPPVHDPCPVAWLLKPALFELAPCRIGVETESELTRGHTAVEFRAATAGTLPHRWATAADADGVFALIGEKCA